MDEEGKPKPKDTAVVKLYMKKTEKFWKKTRKELEGWREIWRWSDGSSGRRL